MKQTSRIRGERREVCRGQRCFVVTGEPEPDFWGRLESSSWEPESFAALDLYANNSKDTFVDIGAWVGPLSLYAAAGGARVVAFEPDPVAYAALSENVAANPSLNVTLYESAIGRHSGEGNLASESFGNSMSSLAFGRRSIHPSTPVRVMALREVSAPWSGLSLVKVDIEGGEFELAPDLARLLRRSASHLLLSTHAKYLYRQARRKSSSRLLSAWLRSVKLRLQKVFWVVLFRGAEWRVWDSHADAWVVRSGMRLIWDLSRLNNQTFLLSRRGLPVENP